MAAEGNYIDESLVDNWPDGATEIQKQEVIDRIEKLVERITGDYFYAKSFDIKLNGNGKNRIFPSLRQDILSVIKVYINEIEIASTEWSYDTGSVFASPDPEEIGNGILFPTGNNNIRITGTLGWSLCPKAINQGCIILCRYENDPTLYTKYGFKSEKIGDWTYDRGTEKYHTGVLQADRLIRPYIKRKPIVGVV